jgi:hypothetical protein
MRHPPDHSGKPEYPEFSNIRSHLVRAEAKHGLEVGYALADALMDAGEYLGRAFRSVTQFIGALHKKA